LVDVRRFLDEGADPDQPTLRRRPLVAAVRAGHDSVVEELLAAGANAVLGDSTGHAWRAVMQTGNMRIAELLLRHDVRDAGAGPSVQRWFAGVRGEVPDAPPWSEVLSGELLSLGLMYAALHDRGDLIVTMRQGREIPNRTTLHALHVAARWGRLEALRALLAIDVHPNTMSVDRTTALMEASRDGREDVARMLMAAGADPNLADGLGETVLHWARRLDQASFASSMERAGADPTRQNVRGQTAAQVIPGDAPLP
jgi:ankyrin repeat protein